MHKEFGYTWDNGPAAYLSILLVGIVMFVVGVLDDRLEMWFIIISCLPAISFFGYWSLASLCWLPLTITVTEEKLTCRTYFGQPKTIDISEITDVRLMKSKAKSSQYSIRFAYGSGSVFYLGTSMTDVNKLVEFVISHNPDCTTDYPWS